MEVYTAHALLLMIAFILLFPSNSFQKKMPIQDSEDLAKCGGQNLPYGRVRRVIDGRHAGRHWPWHALIQYQPKTKTKFEFVASGVLINKRWVLTCAHCVSLVQSADKIQVVLGDYNRTKDENTERLYNVSDIRIHYNYSVGPPITANDVALLKLSEEVKYTQAIRPACLPKANEREVVGTYCTLTGWGHHKLSLNTLPHVLQKVNIQMASFTRCNRTTGPQDFVDNATQFCAGEGGANNKAGCIGDSGGPLSCKEGKKFVVRGIFISVQNRGCNLKVRPDDYNIFTRVSVFIDWIEEQINSPAPRYPKCQDNHWACCIFANRYECISQEPEAMDDYGYYMRYKYCPITCKNPNCLN